MNKQELMKNYTTEQLADMVVELKTEERTASNYTMFLQSKIGDIESELNRKHTEINQIDEILNKLFGVTHDVVKTPDEFEKILRESAENCKTISDFLPTEPIKVADILINAEGKYERNPIAKAFCGTDKGIYNLFGISELRQIAEHLLVYCNANWEVEE